LSFSLRHSPSPTVVVPAVFPFSPEAVIFCGIHFILFIKFKSDFFRRKGAEREIHIQVPQGQ
jgi:hypothetical protein